MQFTTGAPCAAVLAATPTLKQELVDRGFKNVKLWSRGVDAQLFNPSRRKELNNLPRPIFLTVGRVAVEKNLEEFLKLDLPGTKNACDQGECGSCTVYLDGAVSCACLVAAGQAHERQVVTVEGLADDATSPVQECFLAAGAVQCGFCTPGLVVAAHDLLARVAEPDDRQIREALAGNLCRCTGYDKIIRAVMDVAAGSAKASAERTL